MLYWSADHRHYVVPDCETEILFDEASGIKPIRRITRSKLETGFSVPESVSEKDERVFLVLRGDLTFNDNGEETVLHRFDSAIIRRGESCAYRNDTSAIVDMMEFDYYVEP